MKSIFEIVALLLLALTYAFTPIQLVGQDLSSYPSSGMDSLVSVFEKGGPSISYMVIKKGEIILQESRGYANVEEKVLADHNTNYRIASISKVFTATAIIKLISQGLLTYDTTLGSIFPGFPEYGNYITIAHLLTHRSGILEYYDFFVEGEQMSDEKVLESLMSINSINSQPNEKFAYRNSGYAVLAQVVEKVTGLEFEDYMRDEIFTPAGMKNTSLYVEGRDIPHRAYGYTVEAAELILTDQSPGTAVKGDGCIYSSLSDFYHWDQALYSEKLLPQEFLNEACYAYDTDGKTDKKGYGYGWEIDYYDGMKIVQHTGSSLGFTNHYLRVPSLELSVLVFTNTNQNFYQRPEFTNLAYTLLKQYSEGIIDLVE